MPYSYSRKRKPYTSYKKNYRRKYSSTKSGGRYFSQSGPRAVFNAQGVKNAVKSLMEVKQKYHDFKMDGRNISHKFFSGRPTQHWLEEAGTDADWRYPTLEVMHYLVQGQTYDKRIGNKITIKSIDFRMVWENKQSEHANGGADAVNDSKFVGNRAVWIILDKQPNGTAPCNEDVFHSTTGSVCMQKHMKNENRFQILKTFLCPSLGKEPDSKNKFMYYKLKKPLMVRYQTSAMTIADIVENSIWIVATNMDSASAGAGTAGDLNKYDQTGPSLRGTVNIRFYDA